MSFTADGSQELAIQITASDEGAADVFDDVESSAVDMETAVAGAGGVLAGAGAAGLAASASAAADFEQAMADVEKVTDPQTAAELSEAIQDLSGEIPLAQEELAGLATQAGRMGAEGSDEIEEFTRVAGQMGSATTLSADEAGTALGKMSSALDEPLDNIGALGDSINELSNNYQTTSDEIVDSTQRAGQAMSTLGLESDEILGLSAAFNEVSPSSRQAAQRMQQVSESMMNPDNVEMFADMLGVAAEEFETMRDEAPQETMMELMDSISGNQDALDTLNSELTTSQARAFRDTAESADTMREAMETSNQAMVEGGSLAGEVATETDTFHGQVELLKNELNNLAIDIGEQLLPVLTDSIEFIRPAVDAFLDFNESLDGMPALIALVGTTLAGLGAIAVSVGPAIVGALSPILAPVAAIAAAVGVLYYAWSNNLGGIQDKARELWDTLEPILQSIYNTLMFVFEEYAMPLLKRLADTFETHFEAIVEDVIETLEVVANHVETVLGWLESFWDDHGEEVMTIVETTFSFLELTIGTAMRAISTVIRTVLALIRGDFDEALGIIWNFWQTTFGDILNFITEDFWEGLTAAFEMIFGFIKGIFEDIYEFLIGGSIVPDTFNEILEFIRGWISDTISDFNGFFSDLITGFKTTLGEIETWIREKAVRMISDAFQAVFDVTIGNLMWFLEELAGGVSGTIANIANWVAETGSNAIEGAFGAVQEAIVSPIDTAIQAVKDMIRELPEWVLGEIRSTVDSAVDLFNQLVPDTLEIPEISVGGQRLSVPTVDIPNPVPGESGWTVGGGSINVPSTTVGGQGLDLPQLADGGIVDSATIAMIGEAGQEAVVPLDKLSGYLDTAYEVGRQTVTETTRGSMQSVSGGTITARLEIEGDGELAELIRENAELVVEENEQSKSNRISRM
ncbi:phage tail tape measure protein [Natrialba asiatica]|uniref:Phage tail tape measure protein, TP901 family n=1 Tax=Natrialba asiatica (strain ATCC 700177 / DSM 12278 / JCM 9576 / FERM P-10747 / NBRC 102637 / 172P1) TaxID=29540 RepID=M0AR09_NATA1|nr:phage tail tape measure protein [Natrialba asiatica]ELZ00762.1 phage tail tape measure protein, TP901 family [Natrialba asiatica DSM 12278]